MLVSFPIEKRGTAMGVFGFILMFAPAIGPTLSGWIIQHFSWRMLFHFIAPIAIAIILFGFFLLKDKKDKNDLRLDLTSLLLSSLAFGGLMIGFSLAGELGWSHPFVYGTITIGVISFVVFVLRSVKQEEPMLNFRIYKYPMFALSSAISMVITMAMFSGILLLPIFMQTVRGFSPLETGLMLLPGAIVNAFMSPVTGRLFDLYGGRILAVTGLVITTVTTYFLSVLTLETSFLYLAVVHAIRMFGMSMVMMPVTTNGLNELPKRLYPHGTVIMSTLQPVAGAIGVSVFISLLNMRQQQFLQNANGANDELMKQSFAHGVEFVYLISFALTLIVVMLSLLAYRAVPQEETEE